MACRVKVPGVECQKSVMVMFTDRVHGLSTRPSAGVILDNRVHGTCSRALLLDLSLVNSLLIPK